MRNKSEKWHRMTEPIHRLSRRWLHILAPRTSKASSIPAALHAGWEIGRSNPATTGRPCSTKTVSAASTQKLRCRQLTPSPRNSTRKSSRDNTTIPLSGPNQKALKCKAENTDKKWVKKHSKRDSKFSCVFEPSKKEETKLANTHQSKVGGRSREEEKQSISGASSLTSPYQPCLPHTISSPSLNSSPPTPNPPPHSSHGTLRSPSRRKKKLMTSSKSSGIDSCTAIAELEASYDDKATCKLGEDSNILQQSIQAMQEQEFRIAQAWLEAEKERKLSLSTEQDTFSVGLNRWCFDKNKTWLDSSEAQDMKSRNLDTSCHNVGAVNNWNSHKKMGPSSGRQSADGIRKSSRIQTDWRTKIKTKANESNECDVEYRPSLDESRESSTHKRSTGSAWFTNEVKGWMNRRASAF